MIAEMCKNGEFLFVERKLYVFILILCIYLLSYYFFSQTSLAHYHYYRMLKNPKRNRGIQTFFMLYTYVIPLCLYSLQIELSKKENNDTAKHFLVTIKCIVNSKKQDKCLF